MKTIEWSKLVKDEIQRQAEQPPCLLLGEDRDEVLQSVRPEHQVEAEEYFNRLPDLHKEAQWNYVVKSLDTLTRLLKENDGGRFQKPILTVDEAAELLHISKKRFDNIICLERKRQGKTPDFIVHNGAFRRVISDKLIDWVCRSQKKAGRKKAV